MKIKSGVFAGLVALLLLIVAVAYAGGERGGMQDQQKKDQQGAMMQDTETVKQVQQALSDQGYDPGVIDGQWRLQTETALKNFQQAKGMEATGRLDQQTLASLGIEKGAAAGGQEREKTDQQGAMPPDQSGAGGQQGGGGY